MKCKYCGAEVVRSDCRYTHFRCGSWCDDDDSDDVQQSAHCKGKQDADELARYRAMFPVAPWDEGPITALALETLGFTNVYDDHWVDEADGWWCIFAGGCRLLVKYRGQEEVCTTAGQLACLVAARKSR